MSSAFHVQQNVNRDEDRWRELKMESAGLGALDAPRNATIKSLREKYRQGKLTEVERRIMFLNLICKLPPNTLEFKRFEVRYNRIRKEVLANCPGCELLHTSHLPTFGAHYLPRFLDHIHAELPTVDADAHQGYVGHGLSPEELWDRNLFQKHCLSAHGVRAAKRVLLALDHEFPVDFCPILPDLVCMLLVDLSEVEAYTVACVVLERSRHNNAWESSLNNSAAKKTTLTGTQLMDAEGRHEYYFPTSYADLHVFIRTFLDLAKEKVPLAYWHLAGRAQELRPELERVMLDWFSRLFIPVVPLRAVQSILDCFIAEGGKVLYRFGLALLKTMHAHVTSRLTHPAVLHLTAGVHNYTFLSAASESHHVINRSVDYPICEVSDVPAPPLARSGAARPSPGAVEAPSTSGPPQAATWPGSTPPEGQRRQQGQVGRTEGMGTVAEGDATVQVGALSGSTVDIGKKGSSEAPPLQNGSKSSLNPEELTLPSSTVTGTTSSRILNDDLLPVNANASRSISVGSNLKESTEINTTMDVLNRRNGQELSGSINETIKSSSITTPTNQLNRSDDAMKPSTNATLENSTNKLDHSDTVNELSAINTPTIQLNRSDDAMKPSTNETLENSTNKLDHSDTINESCTINTPTIQLNRSNDTTEWSNMFNNADAPTISAPSQSSASSLIVMARRTVSASAISTTRSLRKSWFGRQLRRRSKGGSGKAAQSSGSASSSDLSGLFYSRTRSASDVLAEDEPARGKHPSRFSYKELSATAFRGFKLKREHFSRLDAEHRLRVHRDYSVALRPAIPRPHFPKAAVEASHIVDTYALATRLVSWLPANVRSNSKALRLQYSTEVHGRSLDALYHACAARDVGSCILVIKAIDPLHFLRRATGAASESDDTIIFGGYSSEPLVPQREHHYIGDGSCFLFRLSPEEDSCVWRFTTTPAPGGASTAPLHRRPHARSVASTVSAASEESTRLFGQWSPRRSPSPPGSPRGMPGLQLEAEGESECAAHNAAVLNNTNSKARAIDANRLKFVYPRRDQIVFGSAETVDLDENGQVVPRTVEDSDSGSGSDGDLSDVSDALDDDDAALTRNLRARHKHLIGPGLRIDKDLLRGHSGWCTTYRNEPLCLHCSEAPQVPKLNGTSNKDEETKVHMKHFHFEIAALEVFTIPRLLT